jgi:hypothetical protein
MKFEKISFNESFWKGKSRAEFIAHERHHSLSEKQLNEAFDLLNPQSSEEEEKTEPEDDFED